MSGVSKMKKWSIVSVVKMLRRLPASRKGKSRCGVSPGRLPLKDVVAACEKRWFEATLQAAMDGEGDMQFLVGQMFCSGYGVAADMKKGKLWLQKASNARIEASEDARILLEKLTVGEAVDTTGKGSQTLPIGT